MPKRHTAGLALAALSALAIGRPARADQSPIPSFQYLPTANGFGMQVFDVSQNRITQFLERPYRYMRPNPQNRDAEGVVRRNLVFDTYFGIRSGGTSAWLGKRSPTEVGYVEETNIIRSEALVGSLDTESYFFAPFGLSANGLVMVLRVTNTGSAATTASAFTVENFKLGAAPNPDAPGADGEAVSWDAGRGDARETGPGGGTMIYVPVGGADVSSCADDAWTRVQDGQSLTTTPSCSGSDKALVFQKDLGSIPPGESRTFAVAVLFAAADTTPAAVRAAWDSFAAGRDGETLLGDALSEWNAWRAPAPGLGGEEQMTWRQSEAVLRMGQILEPYSDSPVHKAHGMILASLSPGQWHSGWVRDACYAIVALARSGHFAEAKAALNFFLDAEAGKYKSYVGGVDYRVSTVRYFGDGEEESDYSGQTTRNIETDGWGLVLWAARNYVDASGDTAWLGETTAKGDTVYQALREGVAEAIAANMEQSGLMAADASIWEVHWGNRQHFLYTTAAAARGLCDMAALARRQGESDDRDRYKMLSESAAQAMRSSFVDQNGVLAGTLEKLAQGSNYHDGSTVEAFTWGLIPPSDPIAAATLNDFSHLTTPVGGYKRVEGSSDQYDSDEWILIDLRASDAWRQAGRTDKADSLLDWVTAQASVNYHLIPELYNTNAGSGTIGRYSGSIPMVGYGAGAYLITLLSRAGLNGHDDCGTVDPGDYPDAGAGVYSDAGPEGDGGVNGFSGRTGTACLCTVGVGGGAGGGAPGPGELVLLLGAVGLVARGRRRGGRRRARLLRSAALVLLGLALAAAAARADEPGTQATAGKKKERVAGIDIPVDHADASVKDQAPAQHHTWFEIHGYARMPLNLESTPREPYLVDSDYYLSGFAYTRLYEPDWTELFVSAHHDNYEAKFGIFASLYSDYAETELENQWGIAQASVAARHFLGLEPLSVEAGVFWDRFGTIEPYDTYLFGRTHQGGIKLRWDFNQGAFIQGGVGVHEALLSQNQGTTPIAHLTGAVPLGPVTLGGYLLRSWTRDKRQLSPIEDGTLWVAGLDAHVALPRQLGTVYAAVSRVWADKVLFLAPALELLHSTGGRGLTENYFGLSDSGSGTGRILAGALDAPLHLARRVDLRIFGMTAFVRSAQVDMMNPLDNKDDRLYLKWGIEPSYWLGRRVRASLRYDRVILDMKDAEDSFRALSPRLGFPLDDWGELAVQYTHYFYGDRIQLRPGQVPLETQPDSDAFKVQAQAVW